MSPKFIREGFDLCQCARDLVFREAGIIFSCAAPVDAATFISK